MQVRDVMKTDVITIAENETVAMAANIMKADDVGCLVVIDGDSVVGIITDRDIAVRCTAERHSPDECNVGRHVSKPVTSTTADADALETLHLLVNREVKRVPVFEGPHLVGIVSHSDLSVALIKPMYEVLIGAGRAHKNAQLA